MGIKSFASQLLNHPSTVGKIQSSKWSSSSSSSTTLIPWRVILTGGPPALEWRITFCPAAVNPNPNLSVLWGKSGSCPYTVLFPSLITAYASLRDAILGTCLGMIGTSTIVFATTTSGETSSNAETTSTNLLYGLLQSGIWKSYHQHILRFPCASDHGIGLS